MSHHVESIPPGHPLQSSLLALYARHGLPATALATLRGSLERATLSAAPGAPAVPLAGPLFLVHASATPAADGMSVLAVVSWSDHGLPRMLAGQLDDAISAGIQAWLPAAGPATSTATSTDGLPDVSRAEVPPWEAPVEPAPRNARPAGARPKKARQPKADSPHVDLSAEMAALTPDPAATPAPATPKSEATPAPSGGGWAAAVAASQAPKRTSGSRRPASPSDLGFDVDGDPDLRRGDVLLHPRFGRCKVIKAASDKVKVRRASGAFIDLHMKVCRFTRLPDEDGKRVFDVRIGRK